MTMDMTGLLEKCEHLKAIHCLAHKMELFLCTSKHDRLILAVCTYSPLS